MLCPDTRIFLHVSGAANHGYGRVRDAEAQDGEEPQHKGETIDNQFVIAPYSACVCLQVAMHIITSTLCTFCRCDVGQVYMTWFLAAVYPYLKVIDSHVQKFR